MKQTFEFTIGKLYWGSKDPFEIVRVNACNVKEALAYAYTVLRPNHLQTLTVIGKPK